MNTPSPPHPDVRIFASFAEEAARFFEEWSQRAFASRDTLHVALSGGSTPEAVYDALVQSSRRDSVRWSHIHFYMGDERPVPTEHADSNWGMASRALLDPLDVPTVNHHPMPTQTEDLDEAAKLYAGNLHRLLPHVDGTPQFDLIFLGIGIDGHTASLFPGTAALEETRRYVVANEVPQLETTRLTLTYPILNHARSVVFLVSGERKSAIVSRILKEADPDLPATHVKPAQGSLTWLLDRPAASKL